MAKDKGSKTHTEDESIAAEQAVLDDVIKQVTGDREKFNSSLEFASSPDVEAGVRALGDRIDLKRPYFGQFSVTLNSDPNRELDLRIGREGAQTSPQVVHWDAEVANAYHFRQGEPGVTGRYNISRRREIEVVDSKVLSMSSSYGFGAAGTVKSATPVAKSIDKELGQGSEPTRLTRALERSREHSFDDIVETIQPDQMLEIARSPQGPLLLDGVAGSGKTTVALHRVAYITSPRRNTDERIDINRVLALGPSKQFIRWSSKIRDVLDMGPLRYDTVPSFMWTWLMNVLGNRRVRFDQLSDFSPVRTPSPATVQRVENSIRISCSIPEALKSPSTAPAFVTDLPFKRENVEKRMNSSDWKKFWKAGPALVTITDDENRPSTPNPYIDLYRAKQYFEPMLSSIELREDPTYLLVKDSDLLIEALGKSVPSDITGTILLLVVPDEYASSATYIRDHDRQALAFIKSGSWTQRSKDYEGISGLQIRRLSEVSRREVIASDEISRLAQKASVDANHPLSGRATFSRELERMGLGLGRRLDVGNEGNKDRVLKEGWEAIIKAQIAEFVDTYWPLPPLEQLLPWPIQREDEESDQPDRESLAVLCAAVSHNLALNDEPRSSLKHIVVDEVQELSDAEILFLASISDQKSLTLVGDLRQSLAGLDDDDDWRKFRSLLGNELAVSSFNTSYRSTASITRFCNEILRLRGSQRLADAYEARSGENVAVVNCSSISEHDSALTGWIKASVSRGGSVVVIVPESDSRTLARHYQALANEASRESGVSVADDLGESLVSVMMPTEVKGLEYNHVAVVRADDENYPLSPTAGALLYVACTRATTTLAMFYVGDNSPYIEAKGSNGTQPISPKGPAELKAEQQLAQYKADQQLVAKAEELKAKARAAASAREMLEMIENLKAPPDSPSAAKSARKPSAEVTRQENKASSSAQGWSIFGRSEPKRTKSEAPPKKAKGWSIFGSGEEKPKAKRKNSDWISLGEDEE
jgi:DNA helicase IV